MAILIAVVDLPPSARPERPEPRSTTSTPTTLCISDNPNLDNPNVKNQRMAEFQKSGKIPWYECKTTTCKFCGEEWLLGSFRRHLYDRHDKVGMMDAISE